MVVTLFWACAVRSEDFPLKNVDTNSLYANLKELRLAIPVVVTNTLPYKKNLDRAVSVLTTRGTNELPYAKQALPHPPTTPREAAEMMGVFYYSFFHVAEYENCFVLSDSERPPFDPFSDLGFLAKSNAVQIILDRLAEDPNAFMSGVVIPKGGTRYVGYDFTRTISITPSGVRITDHRVMAGTNGMNRPNQPAEGTR
jgi:hypothetical protein